MSTIAHLAPVTAVSKTVYPLPVFRTEIQQDGIEVAYTPRFIAMDLCGALFESIRTEAHWEQPQIRLFGRQQRVPRKVAWHADPGFSYRYSGQEHPCRSWTPALLQIRALVEQAYGPQHAVLANLYEHGAHSIAPHADDEHDLELNSPILMVSLGATRNFVLKHRTTKARHVLAMEDGSLLMMGGRTNQVALHSVPKTKKPVGARISLTFRRMHVRD